MRTIFIKLARFFAALCDYTVEPKWKVDGLRTKVTQLQDERDRALHRARVNEISFEQVRRAKRAAKKGQN